ncbi:AMP-binding protein [Actinomadura sp. LD22]|uniref:AMP-binding protein n=1 Tax=Actinomadura physcomitrii TaxID=2650748 RepID=A0A6I4MGR7_9ACTN|nr:AMP-binding protein [Actinomadura physcomitrii]MWA02921.1 AMP-binding protein [Actinomadura physcomitrii]
MKVTVDTSRCQGHGLCAALSPALFELDETGRSRLTGETAGRAALPDDLLEEAADAAASCPEEAIILAADSDVETPGRTPLVRLSLGDLLRRVAGEVPGRAALVDGDPLGSGRQWTYAELLAESERIARALLLRFRPGDRIAMWSANTPEWALIQYGAALAGLVLVTVNPALRRDELAHVLRQSRSRGLFYLERSHGIDRTAIVEGLAPELPELETVVGMSDWDAFVDTSDPAIALPEVRPEDPAQIQYTSGTTGAPKGAVLHHLGVVNTALNAGRNAGYVEGGVFVNTMPMFHVGSCVQGAVAALALRETHVLLPRFEPGLVLDALERYRGTNILLVPTMLLALVETPGVADRDLSALETILMGGATTPAALSRRAGDLLGCEIAIGFGQTEVHGVVTQTSLTDSPEDKAETIGRPLPHMRVRVTDPATGQVVPRGVSGEIRTFGYQNMTGYFELPEENAATIVDGWLRTGDLGVMDERGYLTVTGRLKDMIVRGGENIYPREIEEALFAHPSVSHAEVIGLQDEYWGERVAAVVRRDPAGPPVTAEQLYVYCRENMAAFKAPRAWFFVEEFPATPSGKIQKFALRDAIAAGSLKPDWQAPERRTATKETPR